MTRVRQILWKGQPAHVAYGRYVVGLGPQAMHLLAKALPRSDFGRVTHRDERAGFVTIQVDGARPIGQELKQLSTWIHGITGDRVRYVEPVFLGRGSSLISTPAELGDPLRDKQAYLDQIMAPEAWRQEAPTEGDGVALWVLDSGAPLSGGALCHPDLADEARFLLEKSYADGHVPRDEHGHGTQTLGLLAATPDNQIGIRGVDGVSPVHIVKVLDWENEYTTDKLASALMDVVTWLDGDPLRRAVVNLSLGHRGDATVVRDVVEKLASGRALLVAAAGNRGDAGGPVEPLDHPAAYATTSAHVVAVGAVDGAGQPWYGSRRGDGVTVVAPGEYLLSTTPPYTVNNGAAHDYDHFTGTSAATPLVAGAASLLWRSFPSLDAPSLRKILQGSARPVDSSTPPHPTWGYGLLDVAHAFDEAERVATSTP